MCFSLPNVIASSFLQIFRCPVKTEKTTFLKKLPYDCGIVTRIVSVVGLLTAAFDDQVEWLIVKGISNFTDGNESTTDDWNPFASVMAASVVAKLLNDSAVLKRWPRPHYQGDDSLT